MARVLKGQSIVFIRRLIILILSTLFLITLWDNSTVAAQGGPVNFSPSLNLSDTPTRSHHQFIVSDQYGFVHVFWTEDFGGPEIPMILDSPNNAESASEKADENRTEGNPGNTIYYRRWDGTTWTEPVDLFFTKSDAYSYPTAAVDDRGVLYLVWMSSAGLHFSSAPAYAATSAKAWTPDTMIVSATGYRPALLAHGQGQVSLVYSAFRQVAENNAKDGNIYYINSVDGGYVWSDPVQVSFINRGIETLTVFPRMVRDGKERLHLVWYETDPPSYVGTAVYYAQSEDKGKTWSAPLMVDHVSPENDWAATINLAVTNEEEIHLVWICGEKSHRCHQWSTNGGATWSSVQRLFGELHSRANWDALATDASGNIYWVMQLRYPNGLYYTYWDGQRWIDPPILFNTEPFVYRGHGVQLTINKGNELHLVVHHPSAFEVWHVQGVSNLMPSQELKSTPTPTITATPTPKLTATPQVESVTAPDHKQLNFDNEEPIAESQGPATGLLIGILPAVLLVGIVALFKLFARNN